MAKPFTAKEWEGIRSELRANPDAYGLPRREYGSVLLGSFNIRKLGDPRKRDAATWAFLADVCRRFDLLAVQEGLDDLRGITKLKEMMGPEFALAISDATGTLPGERGVAERLAFIYNWNRVRRGEVASDISYDRSALLNAQLAHHRDIGQAFDKYFAELERLERGERKTKPVFQAPAFFLSFIRTPYLVAFEVVGHPSSRTYRLMAINAHLIYGNSIDDRRQEFSALLRWIVARVAQGSAYYKNFVLLGDLNLKFDDEQRDRQAIAKELKALGKEVGDKVGVVFPFLDPHPSQTDVFRTNARLDQTFDQIGLFYLKKDLPRHLQGRKMGDDTRLGPDYGMFNFVQLFSQVVRRKPFAHKPSSQRTAEEKAFLARFEHKVSDHMPIWVRLPLFEAPLLGPPPQ